MARLTRPPPSPRRPAATGATGGSRPPSSLASGLAWLGVGLAAGAWLIVGWYQYQQYEQASTALAAQVAQGDGAVAAADQQASKAVSAARAAVTQERDLQQKLTAEIKRLDAALKPQREQAAKLMEERDASRKALAAGTGGGDAGLAKLRADLAQRSKERDALQQQVAAWQAQMAAKAKDTEDPAAGVRPPVAKPPTGGVVKPEASAKPDPADLHVHVAVNKATKQGVSTTTDKLHFTVSLKNSGKRDYQGLKLVVMACGDSVVTRERYAILGRDEETFDLVGGGQHTYETKEIVNTFAEGSDTYDNYGAKYGGYFIYVLAPDDSIVSFESRVSTFQKLGPQLLKLAEYDAFDRDGEKKGSNKTKPVLRRP